MVDDLIRIAILAPMLAVRVGLRTLLSADEWVEVVAEGVDFSTLEADLNSLDVIVLQGKMPLDTLQPGGDDLDRLAILWVTDDPQDAASLRAASCRAWGIVHPEAAEEELLTALHAVHSGYIIAPPGMLAPLLSGSHQGDTAELVEPLTPRESEVLGLLAQGLANKQIALELDISEHTVKFHVSSIYAKLNATNRTEAVRLGLRMGLIVL